MRSTHIDDDTLVELLDGRLDPAARAGVDAHAADCAPCRALLSALARQHDRSQASTSPATPSSLGSGDRAEPGRVGRYELSSVLGTGGMGIVFAARDPELDRVVAVKLLRGDAFDEQAWPAMEERLRREARAMAKLSHPNVVAVHDVGTCGDRVFVAMEYVDGETLATWLATPRSLAAILDVFRAAGRGLAAAHAAGVVHRDFKPGNVLVGRDGRVRVGDFGIAKLDVVPRSSAVDAHATTATTGAGTPRYMAPEQYRGEPVDARADQFSFCVALYHAVHGVHPFAGATVDELIAAATARELVPPPDPDRVPARIHAAIVRGLSPAPAERFPTMDALVAELELVRPRRRWLAIAGAAAVAAAAVTVTIVVATRSSTTSARSHDFVLPAHVDARRTPGPPLAPVYVEPPAADQLGSIPVAATWCAPRAAAVVVTAYGRIVTVGGDGAVATLASVPITTRPVGSAVVCLPTGRIVGVARGTAFVLDGDAAIAATAPPDNVIDAVAIGDTARWVTPGAIWAWSGTDTATRVRDSCAHPLRLAPDGGRVACARDQQVIVDADGATRDGPAGDRAAWSADGHTVYVTSAGGVQRWRVDGDGSVELIIPGVDPVEVGPWLLAKFQSQMARTWIGRGPAPPVPVLDLGARGAAATLVAAMPPDRVVVAYGERAIRVVALDQPAGDLPADRHLAPIVALAFSADGTALYSADADGFVLARRPPAADPALVGRFPGGLDAGTAVVPRADGTLAITGRRVIGTIDRTGAVAPWRITGVVGPVIGTDDLVVAAPDGGITALSRDGALGQPLVRGPPARGIAAVAIDAERRFALIRAGTDLLQLVDARTGRLVYTVTVRGQTLYRFALVGGDRPAVAMSDTSGQVFVATAAGVAPVVRVTEPITVLAAAPARRRIAIGDGREIVIIDVDRGVELATGALDSSATAAAWSRDGRSLAAAGASTQVAVWNVP